MSYKERYAQSGLTHVGLAKDYALEIHKLVAHTPLLEGLSIAEVQTLGDYMDVYDAQPTTHLISEGEKGDYMVLILTGTVDVVKTDRWGKPSRIAVVQPGAALGEMSMLDGEPRFASCVAIEHTRFAVLSRDSLIQIIHTQPQLGAKILLKLVHMLSQRLRATSVKLVNYLNAAGGAGTTA